MYFIQYAFMCLFIGTSLFFQLNDTPTPGVFFQLNTWVSWAFLLWSGYGASRVILDCLRLSAQKQMSTGNAWRGVLLAVLHFLPALGMSLFMLKEGFLGK